MNDTPAAGLGSVAKGIGWTLALHAAAAFVCCLASLVIEGDLIGGLIPFLAIGIVQLPYMIPACIWFAKRDQARTLKGLMIGACVTFLVNAACFGIMIASFSVDGIR